MTVAITVADLNAMCAEQRCDPRHMLIALESSDGHPVAATDADLTLTVNAERVPTFGILLAAPEDDGWDDEDGQDG